MTVLLKAKLTCTTPVPVGNTRSYRVSPPSTPWPRSTTTSRPTPTAPATR